MWAIGDEPERQCQNNSLKSTADADEFKILMKDNLCSHYSYETDCNVNCYSCRE